MDKHLEAPVFFDDKGHRWKKIRLALLVVILLFAAAAYLTVPKVLERHPVTLN